MTVELEPRPQKRIELIAEYLKDNPTPDAQGNQIHVHHHYAPAQEIPPPPAVNKGDEILAKYTPYFVIGVLGVIVLAAVAVVFWMFISAIITMMLTLLACIAGIAVLAVVLGSVLKTNRESLLNTQMARELSKGRKRK